MAWFFDLILPAVFALLMVLVAHKPARHRLFPPVPLAMVSASSGKLQKPKAGVLGSHDSLTGAPEAYKGAAVEAEASNFVTGISSVAVATALGKGGEGPHDDGDGENQAQSGMDTDLPDPTSAVLSAADGRGTANKSKPAGEADPTKAAVHDSIVRVHHAAAAWP